VHVVHLVAHGGPYGTEVRELGEHLNDPPLGVDQVGRRAVVARRRRAVDVGDDVEVRAPETFEVTQELRVPFEVGVFLCDRDGYGVERGERVVRLLQLDQLLRAERSPERAVGRHDHLLPAQR
jgi:hypothetical protein